MLEWILVGAGAYVCGATPSGLWICRWLGNLDIREYGSRNTGATNVYRVMGWKIAFLVFLLDSFKGAFGVWLGLWLSGNSNGALFGGLMALVGHTWSFWMGFKGGRGVATGIGVLASLMPQVAGVSFLLWLVTVLLTRYVSLGSILGAVAAPICTWWLGYPPAYLAFAIVIAVFVIFRHRENISRLIKGNENKVGRISSPEEGEK